MHRTSDFVQQKMELSLTKAASQRTQSSGMKLKKVFTNYRRLKTQKQSVSIGLSWSAFSFYKHVNRQITYAVFSYSKR